MVDPAAEFSQAAISTVCFAIGDQGFHRRSADSLYRAKTIKNRSIAGHAEMMGRPVDAGRFEFQAELAAIILERHQAISIVQVRAHHGCHERGRIVRFQVCSLVRQHGVCSGMGLVKAVTRKLLHQVEDACRGRFGDAALGRTRHENLALLRHLLGLLLAHGTPQEIGAAQRITRKHLRDLHDLFLVEDHAVGFFEYRLEIRMQVVDLGLVGRMLASDEIVDHARLQRTRPEQGHECDEIAELVGPQALDEVAHATRLELEHRGSLRALQQPECLRIVHRHATDVERCVRVGRIDDAFRPVDYRERLQSEEVELDQADRLDIILVELRDQATAAVFTIKRRKIGELVRRDYDATGMLAGIPDQALQRFREVDNGGNLFVVAVHGRQLFRLLQCLVEGHADLERHQLGDAIHKTVWLAQHAPGIPDDCPGSHCAERNYLRDTIAPVTLRHVLDDAVASLHAKVDVEIRHRDAIRIEETLEEKIVFERVEVGNPEHPGHQRARARSPARTHGDLVIASPAYEIGDNQEVTREAHAADHPEFGLEALEIRGHERATFILRDVAGREYLLECRVQPASRLGFQELFLRLAVRYRESGQYTLAELQVEVAAPRDLERIFDRLRHVGKQFDHLRRCPQVLLVAVVTRSIRIREATAFMNTHSGLVRMKILIRNETHIVARDDRYRFVARQ